MEHIGNKAVLKASFNYRSPSIQKTFKEKIAAEGKTITTVINDLIASYVEAKSQFTNNTAVENSINKVRLLLRTDSPNLELLSREVERLWKLVQS